MGLDLFLYQPVKKKIKNRTEELVFLNNDKIDQKSFNELINGGFDKYVFQREGEYYNPFLLFSEDEYEQITWEMWDINNKPYVELQNKKTKNIIKLALANCPVVKETENIIIVNEIGYQRKGMKQEFYDKWANKYTEDSEPKSYIITSKKDIEEICKLAEDIELTKHNILDKFVEGKTFLYISD